MMNSLLDGDDFFSRMTDDEWQEYWNSLPKVEDTKHEYVDLFGVPYPGCREARSWIYDPYYPYDDCEYED